MPFATQLDSLDTCLKAALVDRGLAANAIGELGSRIASAPLVDESAKGRIGVWESSPGRWPRAQRAAEYCLILAGQGRFVQDGRPDIVLAHGAMVYFPEDTAGEWVITETIRKIYVLFD